MLQAEHRDYLSNSRELLSLHLAQCDLSKIVLQRRIRHTSFEQV